MRASVSKHNHCCAAPLLDDRGKEAIPMQALEHLYSILIDDYRFNLPHRMHLEYLNSVWNCQRVPKFEVDTDVEESLPFGQLFKVNENSSTASSLNVLSWQLVDRV